jgi:hypothetical protein
MTVRFVAVLSGMLLLVAILVLGWQDEKPTGGLGGAYSAGHGLWGVGVRLTWIVPMAVLAASAVALAVLLGRHRLAGYSWAAIGVASILLAVAVGRGGVGYICFIAAASMLLITGLVVGTMANPSVRRWATGLR